MSGTIADRGRDDQSPVMSTGAGKSIDAVVRRHGALRPLSIALEFEGRTTTYGELSDMLDAVACSYRRDGLQVGVHVAYLGKNTDWYFALLLGSAAARVTMTPFNWRLVLRELLEIAADCQPQIIFATTEYLAPALEIARAVLQSCRVVVIDDPASEWSLEHWLMEGAASVPQELALPDDVFLQLYTSGTTGRPKGVMLTNASIVVARAAADSSGEPWDRWKSSDVALVPSPVFHVSGTGWGLYALFAGAMLIVQREFDKDELIAAIAEKGATKLNAVPAVIQMLLDDDRTKHGALDSLRQILYGGSPMPLGLLKRCVDTIKCDFVQLYGMTETFGAVVALPPEDHRDPDADRLSSAGRPMPGTRIRIVDPNGNEAPVGCIGEILIQSSSNMLGYWGRPEDTAKALDTGNWLRTGDGGFIDADGYLYIRDRMKDMIISGGENIYPIEVENILTGHPDVADAAVVGVPDERWGECVKGVVVLKQGATVDPTALSSWLRQRIASYKVPKSFDFVESLPRTASGKVLKRELRARYLPS